MVRTTSARARRAVPRSHCRLWPTERSGTDEDTPAPGRSETVLLVEGRRGALARGHWRVLVDVLMDVAIESIVGMEANHDSSPDHSDSGRP